MFKMVEKRLEVFAARLVDGGRSALVNPHPGINERAEEPRPDGALVISAVAFAHAALITRCVARFAGRERTKAQRSPEMILHRFDDEKGTVVLDETQGEPADGEDLIGTKGAVRLAGVMIHVDDVVENPTFGIPKAVLKGS